jgi:TrmH family RNA methyltransferase
MSPKKIKTLHEKRHRKESGLFLVEGDKNIREILTSDFTIVELHGTPDFLKTIEREIQAYEMSKKTRITLHETSEAELVRLGSFMSNNAGIAIAEQKSVTTLESMLEQAKKDIVLVLDDVRDPGNFGTIIRTAEWYGVTHIITSPTTVDFYNSKVITATMGSFTRVTTLTAELEEVFKAAKELALPIVTADMHGQNIHETTITQHGLLVFGSESHGVSQLAKSYMTNTLAIPRFGNAESLNVSVAAGILLDALRRA